jgi:hypothetical protein
VSDGSATNDVTASEPVTVGNTALSSTRWAQ